jgi:hypothetical protein
MGQATEPSVSQIVLPASAPTGKPLPQQYIGRSFPRPVFMEWAPAWFYSALNWLGKSYYDASSVQQSFSSYMAGSSVDPYAQIGSTRLFVISLIRNRFRLSLAADANSQASMSSGMLYPNTDAGILQMYLDLSSSAIFPSVNYCYIPGRVGSDLDANSPGAFPTGYDPATGLRTVVLGSAVSQIVPLDDFINTHNEQIYDDSPDIIPLATALVFDVTQNNALGATTFVLPMLYTRDLVSAGNYYVSKLGWSTTLDGQSVNYGQTAIFAGGAGYNSADASLLTVKTTSVLNTQGQTVIQYDFGTATAVTIASLSSEVMLGVMSLTYSGASPSSIFANQRIIGFYRDAEWTTCLGVPIYDFGSANASFSASAVALNTPILIYDPTNPSLNGGSLQNVAHKLSQASYVYSTDQLVSILDLAIAVKGTANGAGLSVTTAALDFNMSSTPAAPVVDQLTIPLVATVTTAPPTITIPQSPVGIAQSPIPKASTAARSAAIATAPGKTITQTLSSATLLQTIGAGANTPTQTQLAPVTIEVALDASIPREALSGTGITSVEIGTTFFQQSLGAGAAFESVSAGTVINMMNRSLASPPYPVCNLATATAGVTFTAGIYYVLSLTGSNLTVRGSDGSSVTSVPTLPGPPDPNHIYVGAMVFTSAITSVQLFPLLQLTLPAPTVGSQGVQQGGSYSVRLIFGDTNSTYDIIDSTQTVIGSSISAPNPKATDGSNPSQGDMYFGSFTGGSSEMTVWSAPVFLTVVPSQLSGASFNGTMTLGAQATGVPDYQLQITDSSLFVFSNINADTSAVGSVSPSNVFLASAVINSSPDNQTASAFAPSKLVMGLVRQAQMGTTLKYVFVPEDDSLVIGSTRYMLSVINLGDLDLDPNTLPYPPVYWPQFRYWQFANRHNPYLDVEYTGETQQARISQAQTDTAQIGLQTAQAQEPMQMYLDTNSGAMTVWPIYQFPYATSTQAVDLGQLKAITSTILGILGTSFPTTTTPVEPGPLDSEQVTVPGALQQNNPYTAGAATTTNTNPAPNTTIMSQVIEPASISGVEVTNLNPGLIASDSIRGLAAQQSLQAMQSQQAAADLAITKSLAPAFAVTQAQLATAGESPILDVGLRQFQPIFGFSAYNPGTGEAYIVEVVNADLSIPDQIPDPTQNATYDPYYVRVVFLNTLTCYNMSIIVPSMAYDQYGHLAHQGIDYTNVLSKTNELAIGYLYSLYDSSNNFDNLNFSPYPAAPAPSTSSSESYIFTNLPYSTQQTVSFSPINLFNQYRTKSLLVKPLVAEVETPRTELESLAFDSSLINYEAFATPPAYFVCRRKNWNAGCHLMQATHPANTSIYLAFGGGDLVPFRLDASFTVDHRLPAHMSQLTYAFADRQYDSAKTISVANTPYVVAVTTAGNVAQYMNLSINATAGTATLQINSNKPLQFPPECYVAGQTSTTLISIDDINTQAGTSLTDTGDFINQDTNGHIVAQQFQLIPYNNLVYMIRAVANVQALGAIGGLGITSGLLVDTFVPATTGNLALAHAARYQRSGMQYFGSTYTPTTMVDTLDTLSFTSITGETFYAPTIFIPIPELDSTKGFIADLSNFLGQQIWTFVYPEITAQPGATVNGVNYPNGFNLDVQGNPILSLQKLQFVYDPLAVMYTTNDLTHKYPLLAKQQIVALTNGQIQEGICWRSANVQPGRLPPHNICAQQILPTGPGMDRPNIIYSPQNRPVMTSIEESYLGMSVNSIVSISGVVYNIEESALSSAVANDPPGANFISAVSSATNMLIGVLFDYDNNDLGTLDPYDPNASTKGLVFLNGYLSASGYAFSSPDHFDVNDVLPEQVPLLEQVTGIIGTDWDVAFYNADMALPIQYWSLVYDTFTAAGLPNYIPNVPPSVVDPTFSNRTRSLILSLQNPVRPQELGLMDTYESVVSANLHLENGVTGSIFLSKKADRDVASIGTNPAYPAPLSSPLFGLPTKYDFFLFSRNHYWTLKGATFELIDMGYAMCLVDDGSGTGTKIAQYYIDSDGNYYELYYYVLYSPNGGIIEAANFTLKVTLGAPANLSATPIIPETPNNVNPQDLVTQINKVSNLIYAAFGPSTSGQPPAYIPIQAVAGEVQAAPIMGAPGFNGYALNVIGANRQPVQISQIFSANVTYPIAGSTTIVPYSVKSAKSVPFYGSLSHGLDKQVTVAVLQSANLTSFIPAVTVPPGPSVGIYGGDGLGSLIATPFSCAFQGSGAIPPAVATDPTPGTVMKGDASVFYTFNAVSNTVMDSTGKSASVSGGQYFIDITDPLNPIYGVVALPKFSLNGNTCSLNLNTTLSDGVTSRYTLVIAGQSFQFGPDNAHVTVDRTEFTFNPLQGGIYTVTYAALDAPAESEAPTPITLTPFSITAGGLTTIIDVFNNPGGLSNMVLGVIGRQYTYDPVKGTVTVTQGATTTTVPLVTGLAFASNSAYGYVISFSDEQYMVNGSPMYPYSASTTGSPATYALMTSPQMFTIGGNFYTFDLVNGAYVSVTGNGQTYPINPYQFSINGDVYIINNNVQPYTVVGGGNVYTMTAGNTQFLLNGVQYTITLKGGSLSGATISGQFNITQGNVVVLENYVYQLDTMNGQIVGNGTTYPLTTSGFTYTITTSDSSFTVTTEPNATTVTIANINYLINNTTVVGDGVTYPILAYRTFVDGANTFNIGFDGTVSVPPPLPLSGTPPSYVGATFTDTDTYTVNELAAFDGANYYLLTGTPTQFTVGALTYTLRTDGVSIAAGATQTYIVNATGPLSPNQFTFGTLTIYFGRSTDVAAFDGMYYFAISNGEFTDTNTGLTYTLSGNTAVNQGNSYEIFSNLGQGPYFEVPGGPTYYVNVAVADTGTPNGNIYSVFPISGGQFTIPLVYTITISGSTVTVASSTFTGGPTVVSTLTAAGGSLTGGYFEDPVTNIVYTCVIDAGVVTFIDSSNAIYSYPALGTTDTFVANVVVSTAVNLAVDNEATPAIYPILNNQFIVGTTTYTVNVPVAYHNASTGPIWPMINGRFIVPQTAPMSNLAYTVQGASVTKGYVVSADDQFSADGNVVYTVNDVNIVKATNQSTLSGTAPNQTLTSGSYTYSLNATTSLASIQPAGLNYNTTTKQFIVSYSGLAVTYTVGATAVTDSRNPTNTFPATVSGSQITFTDTISAVTYTFDSSGNNPITAEFSYTNNFFVDAIDGITYYVDTTANTVEAISYLPETTQYAFIPANGVTYLIHYSDVGVVFPVIAGPNVNVGVATVGADTFAVQVDQVVPSGGGAGIPINQNSFEINGNLYTITGTPVGADYSSCQVVGDAMAPRNFVSATTFKLSDPNVTYTLQLDATNLPVAIVANFAVLPSQDIIDINDDVYILTYNTVSSGSLRGQGQSAIAITNSSFTLTNPFDTTKAKFIFDDLDIYDAGSVVGQFTVYLTPTFFIGTAAYTLNPVTMLVTDNNKRPYPLIANPTMFSINGFNYVIDTNRIPHAIIGNNNASPISTDVTIQNGQPVPNSTFTLNGQIYTYVEDSLHNLLSITGTKSYMITQPGLTFKLGSSLIFTINTTPPTAGNYVGTIVPIGTITAGTLVLNFYAGIAESGNTPFFTYKNALYTFVESEGVYVAVQQSYTVYAATPASDQQQLAVFDLNGTTYIITDGSTPGVGSAAGINPGTLWAQTSISDIETQFGVVYGLAVQPVNVTQSGTGIFQFQAVNASGYNTLYNILYSEGSNANVVQVDVPDNIPTFMQSAPFTFVTSYPLTFETGGYNAFTTFVSETSTPSESFNGAYRTPITSTDSLVDSLITAQGDFSLEFWHSMPVISSVPEYHPFTYSSSTAAPPLVYYVDVDFKDTSNIFVEINHTVMQAVVTPPVFSSGWRHFALTYTQPYVILCQGGGFEVKQASNYNFNRDFSIAMTFAASDVSTNQGLLYKGTGSNIPSPELSMSYRVALNGGTVTLQLTDGTSTISKVFSGPTIDPNKFYQVIIVKQTVTPVNNASDTADPYAPPFNPPDLTNATKGGSKADLSGLTSSGGSLTFSNIEPNPTGISTNLSNLLQNLQTPPQQSYSVTISVRTVNDDGSLGNWQHVTSTENVANDNGLIVNSTGSAHLLIGSAYDDVKQQALPLGSSTSTGNIRDLHLFNSAINREGISTSTGVVDIANATAQELIQAGIVAYWMAQYDPNGVVNNSIDQTAVAVSSNTALAKLVALTGHEYEATSLYINGYEMSLAVVTGNSIPASMSGYSPGSSLLNFEAGLYKLQEISIWSMARQQYQIIDDMFGRLIPSNEPFLVVYLSGSFLVPSITGPILPMNQYIDNITVTNPVTSMDLAFSPASIDLSGCPAVGRCGPLITPSLYTPPGVALTVCDTVPELTTYSITLNSVTGTLAGEINEAYVYINNDVLTLYAGKKVGDLILTWVSEEQGDVQIIGYIEGAPPCPMANLTNKSSYPGATSITLTVPNSLTLKYQQGGESSNEGKFSLNIDVGPTFGFGMSVAPFGFGVKTDNKVCSVDLTYGTTLSTDDTDTTGSQSTASGKFDESYKYTVKMEGTLAPYTGDLFMASLNTLTTPATTVGNPSSKTAILPNPNLGGFTTSNPPSALPKTAPTEEKFGQRMYVPSPYGQAFVTSQTLDVYQQTLLQTNTVYGFVRIPNVQIPRDLNIVSFRMSSSYIRPGCLDGIAGYVYNPATSANGSQTYTTSTGEMQVLYDGNFSPGNAGQDASYMRVVEAYQIKKQIDQESYNLLALYNTAWNTTDSLPDPTLTPALDFYNEYIWSSRGGSQEVKHTYTSTYDEVYTTSDVSSFADGYTFNLKIAATFLVVAGVTISGSNTSKDTSKYSYNTTATSSFDITASFDNIETDTQMRYASNNDAHFVMNFNSMYNPSNQSGLNLVIGSDGLVYNIVPSVTSGAGLPLSNNIDTSQTFTQPQPSYTTGNADGTTGNLEPYDRPGKVNLFRTYAFFLQPTQQNSDDFWNTVIDTIWLKNSPDADAVAMRSAKGNPSIPWRLMYRVTYCERFLPPVANVAAIVPQITPVMAVPVLNPATDFIFQNITATLPRPAHNPANDIEANIVLAAPTISGMSAGIIPTSGPSVGVPVVPNNVIPFDLIKSTNPIVEWGDTNNSKLLTQLITSALGLNTIPMSPSALPGSTLIATVENPVNGETLYNIYTDPNGLTVNVPTNLGITVYQDVNANPIQYFDGQTFHSLQADYIASPDGTIMYYIQPPSTYDQSAFDLLGDYDLFGNPGDEWRYYLVSGTSANMTSEPTVTGIGPFLTSTGSAAYTGFTIAPSQHAKGGVNQVQGYVLVQGVLQWPNLNTNAETFSDVLVYKAMSLLDTFPIGDPEVLISFLEAQYPNAPFVGNDEINLVFAMNIVSYFNSLQTTLAP